VAALHAKRAPAGLAAAAAALRVHADRAPGAASRGDLPAGGPGLLAFSAAVPCVRFSGSRPAGLGI